MNKNVDISIIVPVYNGEKYLSRCLDSLLGQNFSGILEVIVVDDASTDNSLELVRSLQLRDNRLKVIQHLENKKQSVSRSSGMNAANGRYIMHVDADDWLLPGALEKVYKKCIESDADVIVFEYIRQDSEGKKTYLHRIKKEFLTTDKHKVQSFFYGATVTKIIKRHLIDDRISGTIGVNSTEDLIYCFEILLKAKTFLLFPENIYVYFINTNSITNTVMPEDYVTTQITILSLLNIIAIKYNADKILAENVLDYYESWLYYMLAKMKCEKNENNELLQELLSCYRNTTIIDDSRTEKLSASIKSKYYCLYQVARRFKIKTALGIFYRSL